MKVAETLVVVAQGKELHPLVASFAAAGHQPRSMTLGRLECHVVDEPGLLLAVGGHGKAQMAAQTQHLIEHGAGLRIVLCAGAAGCLGEGLKLGDIAVGTSTIEHDYKLRLVRRASPRHEPDPRLLGEFRSAASGIAGEARVHFGPIASGNEDVIDPSRARELREATGAVCAAWEGAGAARAASFSGRAFLEVRAITDGADHTAAADFEANLARSMPNLGRLLVAWSLSGSRRAWD